MGGARQYGGQESKQDTGRVAVSLSVATRNASLPAGYRLYLPKEWAEDSQRRKETEVPKKVRFPTRPEIAVAQIRAALAAKVDGGVVLAEAAYGSNPESRDGLTALELQAVVGVQSTMTVPNPSASEARAERVETLHPWKRCMTF